MPPVPPKKKKFVLPKVLTWEQLPGETGMAYEAFLAYRDLGPRRTIIAAYRRVVDPETRHVGGYWSTWCRKYKWKDRAIMYDGHLENMKMKAMVKEKERIGREHVRRIEISAQATLKETASLAHSSIKDVMSWDSAGNATVKPSDEIPEHVAAAIQKITTVRSKGQTITTVEMHPKVKPIDLMGQHFNLWDSEKKQQERTATNVFLELLSAMKAGKFERKPGEPPARIMNAPPGIVIEMEAALIPEQIEKLKDEI